jgi:hypothetical protein
MVIDDWYLAPMGVEGGNADPPLHKRSRLTIGFGHGGALPFQFHLNDGEDADVGFLKVFLTTSPADFSSVAQDPFGTAHRHSSTLNDIDLWGSTMATLIHLRQRPQNKVKN